MKTDTPPPSHDTPVRGSGGNTFLTRSTRAGDLQVELCNECHPFFTGKQKLVDTGGRVERFNKRYGERKSKSFSRVRWRPGPCDRVVSRLGTQRSRSGRR